MNRRKVFGRVPAQRTGLVRRCGVFLAASACLGAVAATTANADEGSLKEAYEAAQKCAQSPQGRDAAMDQYRAIVETHLANEDAFRLALARLAEGYRQSGHVEEGIRFFVSIVDKTETPKTHELMKEIFTEFRLKHPEVLAKVISEKQDSPRPRRLDAAALTSRELAGAVLQRDDPQLRQKALGKLQGMLSSESDEEQKKALATLLASLPAKFDRAPFRPVVLGLLKSDSPEVRALAVRCLPGMGATAAELGQVVPLADDPAAQVRMNVGGALVAIAQGKDEETVVPALMKLLEDSEPAVVERTIRTMWGQYSTPEFDKLLVELAEQPRYHHNVIYFCLSTMRRKSVAVCRRLVEELDDPDWNNSGRAAWGLTYGVPKEAGPLVEEGLLRALPEETNPYTRQQEFRALRGVATAKSIPYLKSMVESKTETEPFQQAAAEILAGLSVSGSGKEGNRREK